MSVLVLEENRYRFQAAISDIAGSDIEAHGGDFQKAIGKVRNWLVSEAQVGSVGILKIQQSYSDFHEWYYEKKLSEGASDDEIKEYPTSELLTAMREWVAIGKPI